MAISLATRLLLAHLDGWAVAVLLLCLRGVRGLVLHNRGSIRLVLWLLPVLALQHVRRHRRHRGRISSSSRYVGGRGSGLGCRRWRLLLASWLAIDCLAVALLMRAVCRLAIGGQVPLGSVLTVPLHIATMLAPTSLLSWRHLLLLLLGSGYHAWHNPCLAMLLSACRGRHPALGSSHRLAPGWWWHPGATRQLASSWRLLGAHLLGGGPWGCSCRLGSSLGSSLGGRRKAARRWRDVGTRAGPHTACGAGVLGGPHLRLCRCRPRSTESRLCWRQLRRHGRCRALGRRCLFAEALAHAAGLSSRRALGGQASYGLANFGLPGCRAGARHGGQGRRGGHATPLLLLLRGRLPPWRRLLGLLGLLLTLMRNPPDLLFLHTHLQGEG